MMNDRPKDATAQNEEDFAAIRAVLDGNKSAFIVIQKKYKKLIFSLVRRMIKNEDDVEDLVQETFIKAYNALPNFHYGFSFSSWLYRIASNNCIDFLRKKRFPTISLSQPINRNDEDSQLEIEDSTFMPDIDILAQERKKVLSDAISDLPENYRRIIRLRHEDEMDYSQIAEHLDIPLGTVKAHLFRARKILFDSLKKQKYLFI